VVMRGCTAAKTMTLTRIEIQFATSKCASRTVRSVRWPKKNTLRTLRTVSAAHLLVGKRFSSDQIRPPMTEIVRHLCATLTTIN
jgi:hypothetical protein